MVRGRQRGTKGQGHMTEIKEKERCRMSKMTDVSLEFCETQIIEHLQLPLRGFLCRCSDVCDKIVE